MDNQEKYRRLMDAFASTDPDNKRSSYRCLHFDCEEKAIYSHSQQKEGPLRAISENAKVYRLQDKLTRVFDIASGKLNFEFVLKGINESSRFYGFCTEHEKIFSEFESKALDLYNKKQATALFLRTVGYEFARKRREADRWQLIVEKKLPWLAGTMEERTLTQRVDGLRQHMTNALRPALEASARAIEKNNFSDFQSSWLSVDRNVGVSSSSCINSHLDRYLDYVAENPDKPVPFFSFNLIPYDDCTFAVATWESKYTFCTSWLIPDALTEEMVNRLVFCESEDASVNPSIWRSYDSDQQKKILSSMEHLLSAGTFTASKLTRLIKFT